MDLGQFGKEFLYSALIAIIFAGTGRLWSRITHRNALRSRQMQMHEVMAGGSYYYPDGRRGGAPTAPAPVAKRRVNFGRVLLQVGIFQFVVFVVGYAIGFMLGLAFLAAGQSTSSEGAVLLLELVVSAFGALALILGFLIIGLRVERSIRWLHLTYVAFGIAATTLLLNWLTGVLQPTSVATVIGAAVFALVQTFVGMGVGGGLSFLIGGRQSAVPAAAPLSQPYGYPAPPSVPFSPPQSGPAPYGPQYPTQQYPPQYPQQPQYPPAQAPAQHYPQYPPQPPTGYPGQ